MKIKILYHDRCFDGVASAAVFARFYREAIETQAEPTFAGLTHKAGQSIDESVLDGDQNAIVDFKYLASDRLDWWFDHHESAFLTSQDEEHYRLHKGGRKFHDPTFKSCVKLITTIAKEHFGYECPTLKELIHWADVIDGAQFPDARTAVELREPVMKLMLVIEAARDDSLIKRLIGDFQEKPLSEVVDQTYVREAFEPLYKKHLESIEIIRRAARFEKGVVEFDVTAFQIDGYNKFIPYYLFPESRYCIGISRSPARVKISVGSNPWSPYPRSHNLAKLCERYGGGGHPVVAAISFEPHEVERAHKVAAEIAAELRKES